MGPGEECAHGREVVLVRSLADGRVHGRHHEPAMRITMAPRSTCSHLKPRVHRPHGEVFAEGVVRDHNIHDEAHV